MIGNDVVDLADPETQPQQLHPRFDERILSPEERQRLRDSDNPHILRWILWAAKEASYKRGRKLYSELIFSPRRFETRPSPCGHIEVHHPRFKSTVQLEQNGQHVHAIANPCHKQGRGITTALVQLRHEAVGKPSQQTRLFACQYLASYLQLDMRRLRIVTEEKIPYLIGPNRQILGDLSFSHHGRFLALAFQPSSRTR